MYRGERGGKSTKYLFNFQINFSLRVFVQDDFHILVERTVLNMK